MVARYRFPKVLPKLTELQIKNLEKLANKLDTVPNNQFDMGDYFSNETLNWFKGPQRLTEKDYRPECGTCACAVGWGPAAGVKVPRGVEDWNSYAELAFGAPPYSTALTEEGLYSYLFDQDQGGTAKAAAKRIRRVLARV